MVLTKEQLFKTAKYLLAFSAAVWFTADLLHYNGYGASPSKYLPYGLMHDPIFPNTFLGLFLFYALLPRGKELPVVVALGLVFEVLLHNGRPEWPWYNWISMFGAGMGGAALLALIYRFAISQGEERTKVGNHALMGLYAPIMFLASGSGLALVNQFNPKTYDVHAYGVDYTLGFAPSFVIGHFVEANLWVFHPANLIYLFLGLWMILAACCCVIDPKNQSYNNVLLTYPALGFCGIFLYNIYPLVGAEPLYGSNFPNIIPPPEPSPLKMIDAPLWLHRNGMPSLHTAWILSVFFAVRRMGPRVVAVSWVMVVFTLLAVFQVGHYFIDVVVAIPFLVGVMVLTAWPGALDKKLQLSVMAGCAAATLISLFALRWSSQWFIDHPALSVVWMVLMIVVPLLVERRLFTQWVARSQPGDGPPERSQSQEEPHS